MLDLRVRVDDAWARLTPAERRVADHVRDHPDDLVLRSSAELARLTGTSKATVSRLLRSLGFRDAQQVRDELLAARAAGVPVAPAVAASDPAAGERVAEARNLDAGLSSLDRADRPALAAALARAARILVIGHRNSYPVALHLRQQLAQARPGVRIVPEPGQALGEELADLSADDVVVVVAFRRRASVLPALVEAIREAGATVILLADPSAAGLTSAAAFAVLCPIDSPSAFDSYAAPMAVVAAIANDVYAALSTDARPRVTRIAALYDALGELEPR
jgi:DNA-binding MurR/RpiR family transcriptional regulator